MATQRIVSVGTTPTLLFDGRDGNANRPVSGIVRVPAGGNTIYIGGPDVVAAQTNGAGNKSGFPCAAGENMTMDLIGDNIWGVTASGTQNVNLFTVGPSA